MTARVLSSQQADHLQALQSAFQTLLPGKSQAANALLSCLLAKGHVLLEDVPGVGKTTFIKGLAQLLSLDMQRVQFTADLLPADITGIEVFDSSTGNFRLHQGPIFTNILLADELNRASPKTQSALLEAMGERHVSIDRKTWPLPNPFFVLAAQNPSDHTGTFPIPESQLDRFSLKMKLGYPDAAQEQQIFANAQLDPLAAMPSDIITRDALLALQASVDTVQTADEIIRCLQTVVTCSRDHPGIELGISTRGGVQWIRLAKAAALLRGRTFVIPDDLIELAPYCLPHRMSFSGHEPLAILQELLTKMDI